MKFFSKILMCLSLVAFLGLSSCDDEKEMIVIEGNLPLKASVLYVIGEATPNKWDIENPTKCEQSAEDNLVFYYEGKLTEGEFKACFKPGTWSQPYIHCFEQHTPINRTDIENAKFQCYSDGDDLKWYVHDPGYYRVTFDLRNWTMSTKYISGI